MVAPLEGLTDVIATSLAEIGGCRLPKRGPHFLIKRNGRPDVRHLSIITKEGSNFWMPREMITKDILISAKVPITPGDYLV